MHFAAKKLYYKIGDVCKIVGVEAYVLRYWEREFPGLAPPKNRGGQRTYRPKDIELLLQIRKLLYEDGFTIAGARRQLGMGTPAAGVPVRDSVKSGSGDPRYRDSKGSSERLGKVREELQNILTLLDRG